MTGMVDMTGMFVPLLLMDTMHGTIHVTCMRVFIPRRMLVVFHFLMFMI